MSAVLAVLLVALKAVGILLLAALVLLLLALVTPVGIWLDWKPDALTLWAKVGLLRLRLWPKTAKKQKKPPAAPAAQPEPAAGPAPAAPAAPEKPPAPEKARRPKAKKAEPSPPESPAPAAEEPAPEPQAPKKRGILERLLDLPNVIREKPVEAVTALLGHGGRAFGRLLRGLHISGVEVFWTVTGADAAGTAILYGRRLAAANTVWAILRDHLDLHAKELRLEPDFTGDLQQKRRFSCQITTRPIIIIAVGLCLVVRVLRDPQLQR